MSNSTRPKANDKAAVLESARRHKAKDKVPLLAHATMRWGRKVRGTIRYFGKIDPALPDYGSGAALAEYHRTIDDLRAGREPRPKDDERTALGEAANKFLAAKASLRDSGELRPRTWTGYHATCSRIIDVLGKRRAVADLTPDDFRKLRAVFAKGRGPVALAGDIRRAKAMFRFCETEGLIDRPCRYGAGFDLPTSTVLRQARAARGTRMFQPEEIRLLLDHANTVMKAMILLGANCGFGQTDLARLAQSAVDLKRGWIDYPRPRTGIPRRCPLWGETVAALAAAIAARPEPRDPGDKDLVFLSPSGQPVVRDRLSTIAAKAEAGLTTHIDTVSRDFCKLIRAVNLNGGRGFYALRHGFQTIAEGCGDFPAVSSIMGHVDASIAARYREGIDDARLIAVTNHVRAWLWPNRRVGRRRKPR